MTARRHALAQVLLHPAHRAEPRTAPTHEATPSPAAHAPPHEAAPHAVALREVITLQPAHLAQLAVATTLLLRTHAGHALACTSGRLTHAELAAAGVATITARGLCVLADAAEQGRSSHEALACWLEQGEPLRGAVPIDSVAYGDSYGRETASRKYTVGEVLELWGLTLVSVIVGDGPDSEVLV